VRNAALEGVVAVAALEEVDALGVLVLVNVPCKSRVVPPHNSHAASLTGGSGSVRICPTPRPYRAPELGSRSPAVHSVGRLRRGFSGSKANIGSLPHSIVSGLARISWFAH